MTSAEDLFALLPRHVLARDADEGGGLLRALLEAIAHEATVLDDDVRDLYEDWFVETAADWALPYLADLVGIEDLPPGRGRRAVIANTLEYRRRKGTVAAAEQVARDVVGRPAWAVEHLRLLATTAHVNHVRLDRPGTAAVRTADERSSPRVAGGALDPLLHTAEVRRAPSGRGRYGIGSVWVHSFGGAVQEVRDAQATPRGQSWWVHPLGLATPLFAVPAAEEGIEHLAQEADLPVPLRPRRLLDLLRQVRAGRAPATSLPVAVRLTVDGTAVPVPAGRLLACRLEDVPRDLPGDEAGTDEAPVWHAMVDAVAGRVRLYRNGVAVAPADAEAPEAVHVSHCLGGRPDVGAGTYDRNAVHEQALAEDPYVPPAGSRWRQHAVVLGDGGSPAAALAAAEDDWAGTEGRPARAGDTIVVSLADSGTWPSPGAAPAPPGPAVDVPDASRLVLVAAGWAPRRLPDRSLAPPVPGVYSADGQRPVLATGLTVTAHAGASVVLDGIFLAGDLTVHAAGMTSLTLSQCTVTGAVRVLAAGGPDTGDGDEAEDGEDAVDGSDDGPGAAGLTVRVLRSLVGRIELADTVPLLQVADSVLSPEVGGAEVPAAPADPFTADPAARTVTAEGADVDVVGTTVRGAVLCRTLTGTDLLADGVLTVVHRQVGCLRYSHAGPGSQTPRQFRPAPGPPSYGSVDPGDPDFLVLTSPALETASESGNEVGVDAHLRRPELLAAARRLVAAHLPAGVDLYVRASRGPR